MHNKIVQPQVGKEHYQFSAYLHKKRWSSIWHQADEIFRSNPKEVLEIGVGTGVLKALVSLYRVKIKTLDIDSSLNPDYISSATAQPFDDNKFDLVCAFQVLEHLPYDQACLAFREICRVSSRRIIISLPDARKLWRYSLHVPKIGQWNFLFPRPIFSSRKHIFDGEHYWEINKREYPLKRLTTEMFNIENVRLFKTFRVHDNPYHRFFIFNKL